MRLFSIKPSITFSGRAFYGVRGWAGKPSHPPLTDFPIVCYALAAAFDVISFLAKDGSDVGRDFYRAATYVLAAGFIVSLGTALTGFWDWWKGMGRDRSSGWLGRAEHNQVWRTANWHAVVMLTVTALVIVDLVVRIGDFQGSAGAVVTVLSILAALLVLYGATYGGTLVFDYAFNVQMSKGVWNESEVDVLPGRKPQPPA